MFELWAYYTSGPVEINIVIKKIELRRPPLGERNRLTLASVSDTIITMTTKAMTIRLPEELKKKLEDAVDHKHSQNAIIVAALKEYLSKK